MGKKFKCLYSAAKWEVLSGGEVIKSRRQERCDELMGDMFHLTDFELNVHVIFYSTYCYQQTSLDFFFFFFLENWSTDKGRCLFNVFYSDTT